MKGKATITKRCPKCNGRGKIVAGHNHCRQEVRCELCKGQRSIQEFVTFEIEK